MSALKYLPELLEAKLIDMETAERIRQYYDDKKAGSMNRLFVVFGVLGSLLVGLGIILIIAHNWDDLTIPVKAGFAFLPLIIGQIACAWVILRNFGNTGFREASAVFASLSVGAAMSLISQIYNIPGDFTSFMLTWMILILPVVYVMRSSVTSMLYICGVTIYGIDTGYTSTPPGPDLFWLLLLAIVPFYYFFLIRTRAGSNLTILHNWLVPLAIVTLLGTVARAFEQWMYPAYVSLFGLFLLLRNLPPFNYRYGMKDGFQVAGFIGTFIVLMTLTFPGVWREFPSPHLLSIEAFRSPEFLVFVAISVAAGTLAFFEYRWSLLTRLPVLELFFVVFAATFVVGLVSVLGVVLMNIYVLALGIWIIREGERRDHLGILNLGLAVLAMLTIARFFDSEITFVIRGLLFLAVGTGFFVANYRLIKKRKTYE